METNNTKCHFVFLKQQRNINRRTRTTRHSSPDKTKHYPALGLILNAPLTCDLYMKILCHLLLLRRSKYKGSYIISSSHSVHTNEADSGESTDIEDEFVLTFIIREYQNKSIRSISVMSVIVFVYMYVAQVPVTV